LLMLLLLLLEFAMNSVLSCDRLRFWLEPLMEECDDADGDCDKAMSRAMSNPTLPSASPSSSPSSHHRHRDHCSALRKHPVWHNDLLRPLTPRPTSDEHTLLLDCDSPTGSVCRPKLQRSLVNDFCDASGFVDDESSMDVVRQSSGTPKQWAHSSHTLGDPTHIPLPNGNT
jgi:hypothetical protein